MNNTMSWLRGSPIRNSFTKQRSRDSPPKDADPTACYDSYRKHWQQSHDIISQSMPPNGIPSQDDVLGVVNHVDRMATLLLLEIRGFSPTVVQNRQNVTPVQMQTQCSPCLEYLLSENLLDKLYEWSRHTGRFGNAVRLEQLKLYEMLVSHGSYLLAHESITKPLLRLLGECEGDVMPLEVEKKLVALLNHLCVALVQNAELLDLFFQPLADSKTRFIIFNLLIPHIHREGGVGQQARDAMLLIMSLSGKNDEIGSYIADQSNICPVLATGLSGLYSVLPRTLEIETEDWHRLTVDDINDIPDLSQLMNSLEFCNAVAQVAHPFVQKQLLEYLYRGFLVPVIGPALLQTSTEELVAATAYFDLFVRTVTEPGLLYPMVRFLLEDDYDNHPILDYLIKRISYKSRLSIVTLALFETLVDLNCEDVMLKLCLSSLTPCSHIMLSQRSRLKELDPRGAEKLLSLIPECCLPCNSISLSASMNSPTNSLSSIKMAPLPATVSLSESLYSNYLAYLRDARQKITSCHLACLSWTSQYDNVECAKTVITFKNFQLPDDQQSNYCNATIQEDDSEDSSKDTSDNITSLTEELKMERTNSQETMSPNHSALTPEEQAKLDADIAELLAEDFGSHVTSSIEPVSILEKSLLNDEDPNTMNSLQLSIGESSGYESFAFKGSSESTPDHNEEDEEINKERENHQRTIDNSLTKQKQIKDADAILNEVMRNSPLLSQRRRPNNKEPIKQELIFNGTPSVGLFLDELLKKLESMTENNVYVNLHLTGLISRLAIYSQPLLKSFLLNHSLVFQPSIRSLFQVLAILKHKIDRFLSKQPEDIIDSLVRQARIFLIDREHRLINMRKNALEAASSVPLITNSKPIEKAALVKEDPPKRRSITSSLTLLFRRSSSSATNDSQSSNAEEMKIISDTTKHSRVQNVVLCAVILGEWLKELAAITQEHTIVNYINAAPE